ncbi:transglycosylase SLT domain-containing protein [Aliivibrio fischeri]|uniref:lytic transglycosylase domain-containing protein n=1 Tax=Aliivibrio fischeri TaxID=668 RepID=UPI0012D9C5FB|nr:lytic transglycosylase domain-containing protein [Aliivibrio fischeri]MUK91897.1 transglycosylase SLT domain-containing protein [Aliivibrio fischeri]
MKWLLVILFISPSVFANCFEEVSQKYQIKADLLRAIAFTESTFNSNAVNCANSNGTCDYGFAQINLSEWEDELIEFGISITDLKDPCQNLHFGAWVLAKNFESHGRNWNSVGAYNAGFAKKRQAARDKYINLVKANLLKIQNGSI